MPRLFHSVSQTLFAVACLSLTAPALAHCTLGEETHDALERWKTVDYALPGGDDHGMRALALIDCLGAPDPFLRDDIAFGALASWLRDGRLDSGSIRLLELRLLAVLDDKDADGYHRPFVALALSEVARTDRVQAWMMPDQRSHMVAAAADYMRSVRDYRGYVDGEGWRHGVAHGADWVLQLVLNKALQPGQVMSLLAALGTQVMPADSHVYAFGEPGRLARPVVYAVARGDLDQAALDAWLQGLTQGLGAQPAGSAQAHWWLRRSNLEAFLHALGHMAAAEQAPAMIGLVASVDATLAKLP